MICLFVCLFVVVFFMLKLLQYCNYIIIVMQIKLMLLLLLIHPFLQALAASGRQNDIVVHSRSSTRVDGTTNVREGDITDHGVL